MNPSDPDAPAALLDLVRERATRYLESLPERPVFPRVRPGDVRARLDGPLPAAGEAPAAVLRRLADAGDAAAVASAGPRYFGFVIGGALPVALGADWLTSVWDQNAGLYVAAPVPTVAEEVAARWLLELFGLPARSSVGFVTGGQMANFTALAAARHAVLRRSGWDDERDGLQGAPRVRVVAGEEAHVTIHGALQMLGLGSGAIVEVPTDGQGRVIAAQLRDALRGHDGPTIVCAQAGNVNTGAVDPLAEVIDAAHEGAAWVHVDGAFGLWAAASPRRRGLLAGIERADSWATDAHKWLNVPYDCGLAIVADPEAHFGAMSLKAEYLEKSDGTARDPLDWTPEFSRRGRGVAVWAALASLGRDGVAALVDRCCDHAARFAELLGREPGIEVLNEVVLNQVLVRFHPESRLANEEPATDAPGADAPGADALTRDVVRRVQEDRVCWLSGTRWRGRDAMRISVSNWSTTAADVERSVDSIRRCYLAARAPR